MDRAVEGMKKMVQGMAMLFGDVTDESFEEAYQEVEAMQKEFGNEALEATHEPMGEILQMLIKFKAGQATVDTPVLARLLSRRVVNALGMFNENAEVCTVPEGEKYTVRAVSLS